MKLSIIRRYCLTGNALQTRKSSFGDFKYVVWLESSVLSSCHWYYLHGSRMYITHIKRDSRTPYVVLKIKTGEVKLQSRFFSQNVETHDTGFWK